MIALLEKLVHTFGPSGQEQAVAAFVQTEIAPYVDDIRQDALGNLIALKRGQAGGKKVMLAAHMDEIGVLVSHVDEKGFCRVRPLGGLGTLVLLSSRVRFANGTIGVFGVEREERKRPGSSEEVPPWEKWYLDVGATSKEDAPVQVGDAAAFYPFFHQQGSRLFAQSMDDRSGCAVLLEVAKRLKKPANDVYFVFTVQEEVGTKGAMTATYGVQPDVGIAVDVTIGSDTPKAMQLGLALGQGAAIKVMDRGMIAHYGVRQALVETAETAGIPYQLEVLPWGTTDARSIQLSREGVPAGAVSIPSRYVHSKAEVVDENDMIAAADLLLTFVRQPVTLG